MEDVSQILDEIDGVTLVHARYYDLCSEYYKVCTCGYSNKHDQYLLVFTCILDTRGPRLLLS